MSTENLSAPQADQLSPLEPLHFLLGKWQAISQPGEATGGFHFTSQLQGHVIIRTNYADYPDTPERPAYHHEDLMIIYYDEARALYADYYDNEGHVIRHSGLRSDVPRVYSS